MKQIGSLFYFAFALSTAVIGKTVNNSIFWAVVDFFFAPFAWIKWMVCEQVNVSIIKEAFNFFLQ